VTAQPAMLLALKIDVDTLRGTREGVPNLVVLLKKHGADATFLFSLGPDHTGRAIKRVFRPGFFGKVRRTSIVRHYGVKTLLYGTVLPGPDIGRRAGNVMRATRDAGFEVGIHTWDHVRWQDGVATANAAWTRAEMQRACDRYTDIFGSPPLTHGAAGWQMNLHALRLTQRLGFEYCSDGRGAHPHLPVWNGELIRCPQLPTTLPTMDELIGRDGITEENVAAHLLERTKDASGVNVYTLHAELEGMRLAPAFEQLLAGWKAQGWRLVSMRTLLDSLQPLALPRCEVGPGVVAGRSGTLLLQRDEFLADVDLAAAG
jgi:undecaprenyl phosphate-alpha-L-ara4FN deformylase